MATRRTYVPCSKCGKNSMGKYKDDQGNVLCRACAPSTSIRDRHRLCVCIECGHGHYDMANTGLCAECRVKTNRKSDTVKRCKTCNKYIRSSMETMVECISCIGEAKYKRLLRVHKKEPDK